MPSKIPPCNYQRKTICGYHRRAVASVKFSPGGTLLGSACELTFLSFLVNHPMFTSLLLVPAPVYGAVRSGAVRCVGAGVADLSQVPAGYFCYFEK